MKLHIRSGTAKRDREGQHDEILGSHSASPYCRRHMNRNGFRLVYMRDHISIPSGSIDMLTCELIPTCNISLRRGCCARFVKKQRKLARTGDSKLGITGSRRAVNPATPDVCFRLRLPMSARLLRCFAPTPKVRLRRYYYGYAATITATDADVNHGIPLFPGMGDALRSRCAPRSRRSLFRLPFRAVACDRTVYVRAVGASPLSRPDHSRLRSHTTGDASAMVVIMNAADNVWSFEGQRRPVGRGGAKPRRPAARRVTEWPHPRAGRCYRRRYA